MSKLFILGTGFSKAVSEEMGTGSVIPTMKELGDHVKSVISRLPGQPEIYKKLVSGTNNVEELLTYLYDESPWKSPSETHLHKSAFLVLSTIIADYINECEEKVLEVGSEPPEWCIDFLLYLHEKKPTVATFNYDTAIEKLSYRHIRPGDKNETINIADLYQSPITRLATRDGSLYLTGSYEATYRLLKLHGSINWFFSGDENIPHQEVYYSDVFVIDDPSQSFIMNVKKNRKDLLPLIIPPVAEKTRFYNLRIVRSVWRDFRSAIEEAEEIYCVGYSLPRTDLTTQLFFSAVMNDKSKKIFLVNLRERSEELVDNYRRVLGECNLITDYITDDSPIERMVRDLVNEPA